MGKKSSDRVDEDVGEVCQKVADHRGEEIATRD